MRIDPTYRTAAPPNGTLPAGRITVVGPVLRDQVDQGAVSQVIVDGVLLGNRTDSDPALTVRLAGLADQLGYREIWLGESTGHDAFALAVAVGGTVPSAADASPSERAALCLGPLPAAVRDPVTAARGAASVATLTGRRIGLALTASTGLVVVDWHG